MAGTDDPIQLAKQAFHQNDAPLFERLLQQHAELRALIDQPVFPFDSPAITWAAGAGKRDIVEVLLRHGADINDRSRWWAGGFGVLDSCDAEMAAWLIERGATVDAHAASRLGMMERLVELVAAEPAVVHGRGGDGQTPLHFASTVEIAAYLLDHGADINALDIDHESTAAQYRVRSHPDPVRLLIGRGCRTDILMAAHLGDADLVRQHLDANPDSIQTEVSADFFPMRNPRAGGTIYIWVFGGHKTAHQVALEAGHGEIMDLLLDRSPVALRLVHACTIGDGAGASELLSSQPGVITDLAPREIRAIVHGAEANNAEAVRLMLGCGWPADGGQAQTPLHWAAWHGNLEMARVLLTHHAPLEVRDPDYSATPLGWAIHGSEHGWNCRTGDYAGVLEALLDAGAAMPEQIGGSAAVQSALRRRI